LIVAGTGRESPIPSGLDVRGDLRLAANATVTALSVQRNAWIVGRLGHWGNVTIGGTLFKAPSASVVGTGSLTVQNEVTQAFTVEDPCDCGARLDIAAMETSGSAMNDNAIISLDSSLLANVNGPTRLELPCGRYRFDAIGGSGTVQLRIKDRTAIFVDQNVDLSAMDFQLTIDPGGELDWFIHGNLNLGTSRIGDVARPSAVRIYVAGSNDIVFASGTFAANLYAPNSSANVTSSSPGVFGSIFVKSANATYLPVRYDRAILNQGSQCAQPSSCSRCGSCGAGAACIGSSCGSCTQDEDCCLPLVCQQGACKQLLP
jgi:hypothetical protein